MARSLKCPFCFYESPHGVQVCRGCNADVVYGMTDGESGCLKGVCFLSLLGLGVLSWPFLKQFAPWKLAAAFFGLFFLGIFVSYLLYDMLVRDKVTFVRSSHYTKGP